MNNALVLWCQYVNTIYISGNEIVCQEAMNNSSFGKSSASTHFVLRCLSWQCRCFAFASLDTSQMRPESTNLGRRPLRLLKHFETISCCFWSELSFFLRCECQSPAGSQHPETSQPPHKRTCQPQIPDMYMDNVLAEDGFFQVQHLSFDWELVIPAGVALQFPVCSAAAGWSDRRGCWCCTASPREVGGRLNLWAAKG